MLNYIAAVATAATLFISPMLSHAAEAPITAKKAVASYKDISVNTQMIVVNTPLPVYLLSKQEQSILRAALLKSVKILSPSRTA